MFVIRRILFLIFLIIFSGCYTHRFQVSPHPCHLQPACIPENIRVAVVLGSGGVRGMAHVGVLQELENAGIPIDLIVGCSAGSMVGALYGDNPCADEIKWAVSLIPTDSFLDINIWHCRYGLSQGQTMLNLLNQYLFSETFEDLKIPLVVVATDLHSGELVPIGSGPLLKAIRASCSMPFFYVPCEYMGRMLVDGGVVNPVPVKVAKDLGADFIIAVDLSELLPRTFPSNLFQVATRSAEIAFMWHNESCTREADVIIRPKTCGVGTFNDRKKNEIYWAGRYAAREQIGKIKASLASRCLHNAPNGNWRRIQLQTYAPEVHQ